jgi:hypothetical protein
MEDREKEGQGDFTTEFTEGTENGRREKQAG